MGASARAQMIRGRQLANCSMASCGAMAVVPSLTDGTLCPSMQSENEKSKISRNDIDLCGIRDMGDTLRLGGKFSLISSQYKTLQYPISTFSFVSCSIYLMPSGDNALLCSPRSIAASISSLVQFLPQSTGHPRRPHAFNMSANGCASAGPVGYIKPRDSPIVLHGDIASLMLFAFHCGVMLFLLL